MSKKRIPLHPGEFVKRVYIEEANLSLNSIADALLVNKGTFSRFVKGEVDLSPKMVHKLSNSLGRTPESWMNMQQAHSLAKAEAELGKWKPKKVLVEGKLEVA